MDATLRQRAKAINAARLNADEFSALEKFISSAGNDANAAGTVENICDRLAIPKMEPAA